MSRLLPLSHGVNQAVLAGFLSSPYVLQRLSNFDPGLEFKTAMLYADSSSIADGRRVEDGNYNSAACAVVLGDRDVQETLRRLGGTLTTVESEAVTAAGSCASVPGCTSALVDLGSPVGGTVAEGLWPTKVSLERRVWSRDSSPHKHKSFAHGYLYVCQH